MDILVLLALGFLDFFSAAPGSLLTQIQAAGEIRIATRNSPAIYYEDQSGPAGLEYELAARFAEQLGVRPHFIVAENSAQAMQLVAAQQAHFAAAGLAVIAADRSRARFGPAYHSSRTHVVCRATGKPPPRNLDELSRRGFAIAAGVEQTRHVSPLKHRYPQLQWQEYPRLNAEELLQQVSLRQQECVMAAANELREARLRYPALQPAFDLLGPQELAWAFPRYSPDDSLYLAAAQFFSRLRQSGELATLIRQYEGEPPTPSHASFDMQVFQRDMQNRLPLYIEQFQDMGKQCQVDWRLLAAIGYQESHWEATAVSKTGVRGLMMLTEDTAQRMGVSNREDPHESIRGGARYFSELKASVPESVAEPERVWMALAAYNLGLGHLQDARRLARDNGGNPNQWPEVEKYILVLSNFEWHSQTRHGYARGYEAIGFVKNVRKFYDILVAHYKNEFPAHPALAPKTSKAVLPEI
jgi:membrane-bound lytic murein transglycosylase F